MFVNKSRGFVFIHNPKAGGRLVRRWLKGLSKGDQWRGYWKVSPTTGIDMAHLNQDNATQITGVEIDDLCKICVIRDPYCRLWSAYKHLKTSYSRGYLKEHGIKTFSAMLAHIEDDPIRIFNPALPWFQPQHLFACRDERLNTDILIRFESLSEGLNQVADRFLIDNTIMIEQDKLVLHPIRSQLHKQVCENLYAKDFDLLGFDKRDEVI